MVKGFATLHRKALGINNLLLFEDTFWWYFGPPDEASAPCKTRQIYGIVRCTDNHNVLSERIDAIPVELVSSGLSEHNW